MSYLDFSMQRFMSFMSGFAFSSVAGWATPKDLTKSLEARHSAHRQFFAAILAAVFFLFLGGPGRAQGQTATVDWTDVHQVIDGFGASHEAQGASMTTAQQNLFFGTGAGQLGLSIYRVGVTDGNQDPGDCTSVGSSCAGVYVSDMQAVIAAGGKVYGSPWTPPSAYKTNSNYNCTGGSGSGALASGSYANYATWLGNFAQSLAAQGISLYGLSIQNEPDECTSYDSALWTAGDIDNFIKTNLGPTLASASPSTLIFMPENSGYGSITGSSGGGTCGTDSACTAYVGGYNWHDYDATTSGGVPPANSTPYPSGWASGKKWWETEVSQGSGFGPSCGSGSSFTNTISDGLCWGTIIDQRMQDGANAWLYWQLVLGTSDNQMLMNGSTVAVRAYVLAQYSKFIRPGYFRIDATHAPQSGVTVSAYQQTSSGTLVIIATNYTSSSVPQTFNITNAPTFSTLTPTITSGSLSLAAQLNVTVSGNSFTYTLPAASITTFVGSTSAPSAPSALAAVVVQ